MAHGSETQPHAAAVTAPIDVIIARLDRVTGPDSRGWYKAHCPFHDDAHPSFGFTDSGFKCLTCQRAGSLRELAEHLGIAQLPELTFDQRVQIAYDYRDEDGKLLYQCVRLHSPKDFRQRRPDGRGGWIWNLKGVRLVPYRLPEVLAIPGDQALFVVEGEKDADRLWAEGLAATTNPMGAGKWRPEYSAALCGRSIVILPDNDGAGRSHTDDVARSLDSAGATVRVLALSGLSEKGDVSDWLDAGGTAGDLVALAQEVEVWRPEPTEDVPTPERYARTDAGNAELFASQYASRLRFNHRRKKWLVWAGQRWNDDADAEVVRHAIMSARHRGLQAVRIEDFNDRTQEAKFAIASENRSRLDAMLEIARAQPALADSGEDWDADGWLFGVANGVVDLRTGRLREGQQADRMTMFTPIVYDPDAEAPRWERFLSEVFGNDAELISFIQEAVGYSLTGDTSEQCLFLGYGTGANGKSVFLSILRLLSGRYTFNAPFASLERRSQSSIPNDLAALAGKRLVTSSETNEGAHLNEARIKALTGCDPITARFLHAEFFTFVPVAKYWLAVNHKPVVTDDSVGFWRRVRLIPFTRQFRGAAADKGLQRALEAELPGILAWAIRGALLWQQHGELVVPHVVKEATEAYRNESDPLAAFLDDCCVVDAGLSVGASELYRAYKAWCDEQRLNAREILSSTIFGGRMNAKFERRRSKRGNRYVGVALYTDRPDLDMDDVDEGVGVQGRVQGLESDAGENPVLPQEDLFSREDLEKPYTTLHPCTASTATERPPACRRCGVELDGGTSNLCEPCRLDAVRSVMKGQR